MKTEQTKDPRIPPREEVVLRYVLEAKASEHPDKVFMVDSGDGPDWTYADLLAKTRSVAAGLESLGVEQGQHVASFLPNSLDAALIWFGLNYLGAVYVPLNPAYRGTMLAHTIETSDANLVIVHAGLAERLEGIDLASLTDAVMIAGEGPQTASLTWHDPASLTDAKGEPGEPATPIEPWHTQGIWYTSGTTGPSKAVLSSYLHAYSMFGPKTWPFIDAEDRWMINLPLFHMGGTGMWNMMLLRGGSVAFVPKFRTPEFWPKVRSTGTTGVFLLGTMAAFLESAEPTAEDADHPMRLMFMVPVVDDVPAFSRRFGVEVRSVYNMSELCMPIFTGPTPDVPGLAGRVRDGVEVRIADDNDCEVAHGEVGEILVRSDTPWSMNHGYYKMPEATARAWRNGWFHSGDFGKRDDDGNFWFVDRKKDAVRRRGEFVSSLELETELCIHPSVSIAAVVGIPNRYAEEDVMAVVKPVEGEDVDPAALIEWLRGRVAHFMVPRYVRVLEDLPMTPTEKVRKVELRDQGVTEDTWDREAAGIVIKPEAVEGSGFTRSSA